MKKFQVATNYYDGKQIIERIKIIKEHKIDKQKLKQRKQDT